MSLISAIPVWLAAVAVTSGLIAAFHEGSLLEAAFWRKVVSIGLATAGLVWAGVLVEPSVSAFAAKWQVVSGVDVSLAIFGIIATLVAGYAAVAVTRFAGERAVLLRLMRQLDTSQKSLGVLTADSAAGLRNAMADLKLLEARFRGVLEIDRALLEVDGSDDSDYGNEIDLRLAKSLLSRGDWQGRQFDLEELVTVARRKPGTLVVTPGLREFLEILGSTWGQTEASEMGDCARLARALLVAI